MKITTFLFAATFGLTASAQGLATDLPAVYITTDNGEDITSTEVYTTANLKVVEADGSATDYPSTKVRGRGNTLFTLEKKPYKLKLTKKTALAGADFAKGKKWNLMADHGDKTLLRNAVASFIALEAGQPFAPTAKFVDLTVNEKYVGTYRLTDQIDIRKKRVNITEQPEVVTSQTDISGGYLLEIDDSADELEGAVITTPCGMKVSIKSPDEDVITNSQIEYISSHLAKFENALFSDKWLDSSEGYLHYLDLNSLVQWYITAELTAEPNSFRSVYFYKDKADDKFYFGPVWDFDFAFDNSARWGSRPKALVAQEGRGPEWCYTWINRLRQDPQFHHSVNETWKRLIADGLIEKTIDYIDITAAKIEKSQQKNFGLYAIDAKAHDEQHLFSSYAEGVEFLKDNLRKRAQFLTEAFATLAAGGSVPVVGNPDESTIGEIEIPDYRVTVRGTDLLFTSTAHASGTWTIYTTSGAKIKTGEIQPVVSLASLASGSYIVCWSVGNSVKSAKFHI
ncbi:MAG: CotH kinase family protein [Muribaculaceae bacterium]|nr:CotH kinase family protein [Muribaculaceae bacterium]